ncbi:MAG: response regulator transcription factor [Beijerinckiaceae bacterium]|nr:response regulator transcription factor [Beijerinckiaceae bacterium]
MLIDNDLASRTLMRTQLAMLGFNVAEFSSGDEDLAGLTNEPDLIIASTNVDDADGTNILRAAQKQSPHAAIILLSNIRDETGIVNALDLGADDYITKPFGMEEFLARVRTALRHRLRRPSETPAFQTGTLCVDEIRRNVTVDGKLVKLTPKEYELVHILVQNAGKVVTCGFIMKRLWSEETTQSYLRVLVRAVRRKIESVPEQPFYLLTVPGVGYLLRAPDQR